MSTFLDEDDEKKVEKNEIIQIDQDGEKLDIKKETDLEQREFQKYLEKESEDWMQHEAELPETTDDEEQVIFWFKYLQEDKLTSSSFLQEQKTDRFCSIKLEQIQ